MSNTHPNRGWRTRMHAECAGWLSTWTWPPDGSGAWMLTPEQQRDLMAQAFRAGYETGRVSRAPKPANQERQNG